MNRLQTVTGWVLMIVGSYGFFILLLASPIGRAIWSGGAMWTPWEAGENANWAMNLGRTIQSEWRVLVACAGCLLLAGLGGWLRRAAEMSRRRSL